MHSPGCLVPGIGVQLSLELIDLVLHHCGIVGQALQQHALRTDHHFCIELHEKSFMTMLGCVKRVQSLGPRAGSCCLFYERNASKKSLVTPRVQVPNNHILSKILIYITTILKPST